MAFAFNKETEASFAKVLKKYPVAHKRAALIPALYLVQEQEGYLTLPSMLYVAERLEVAPSEVLNTATFYTLLRKKPLGRYHLQVCTNVSCYLRGSDRLLDVIQEECGIKPGEISADRAFSCEEVQCLASCGTAPAMQVNWDYHEEQSPESLKEILQGLKTVSPADAEIQEEA
jgi:NADH-quinone oxidoreductase subunit E